MVRLRLLLALQLKYISRLYRVLDSVMIHAIYFTFLRPTILPESSVQTFVSLLLLYLYNVPSSERPALYLIKA